MKYALIGCGRIATNHIKAAVANGLKIAAVCDIVPERMGLLLAKHGLENDASIKHYENYVNLIDEVRPELVSIATESGIHARIALDCIDRGINVIIEKPMAMSMADAEEIIRRSEAKGVKVSDTKPPQHWPMAGPSGISRVRSVALPARSARA